jgi:hypothetical protein
MNATRADQNRFHDDRSHYTGVYAHGGPSTVDSVHPATSFGYSHSAKMEEDKQEQAVFREKHV